VLCDPSENWNTPTDGEFRMYDGGTTKETTIRALNRLMRWNLPTDGPKTLNGLIVEFLEYPASGDAVTICRT